MDNKENFKANIVSKKIVERLTIYKREIEKLIKEGKETIFSYELEKITGIPATTIRKDFSILGVKLGHVKYGYNLIYLKRVFDEILGVKKPWNIAIVGIGNLGRALMGYTGFEKRNFNVICGFDIDEKVVGTKYNNKPIFHLNEAPQILKEYDIHIIVLTVPSEVTESVFKYFYDLGIRAFLNLTPVIINCSSCVYVENVDLTSPLEKLTYYVDKNICNS